MTRIVDKEFELYEPMRLWLQQYLECKYKESEVITVDSHSRSLDKYLEAHGVLDQYPQVVGLDIQIDVLGIIKKSKKVSIIFIEAKRAPLTLKDLGQLWTYCKLCNPSEAFLLSPNGLGSLNKVLVNLSREDLLDFGERKKIKMMKVGRWDSYANMVDSLSVIPKT